MSQTTPTAPTTQLCTLTEVLGGPRGKQGGNVTSVCLADVTVDRDP